MAKYSLRKDKGVAGLDILLSVLVMVFVIGFLVMIFALMSAEIQPEVYESTTVSVSNETLTTVAENGENFANKGKRNAVCVLDTTKVYNATDGVVIKSGNYTGYVSGQCYINATTAGTFNNTNWKVTYTYTWDADTTASDVINETSTDIGNVTDWFGIIIVITAMVVLILLTVIIISAIKGSGMIGTMGKAPTESA